MKLTVINQPAAEGIETRRLHQEKFLPCCGFRTRNFVLNAMTMDGHNRLPRRPKAASQ